MALSDTFSILFNVQGAKEASREIEGVSKKTDNVEKSLTKASSATSKSANNFTMLQRSITKAIVPLASFAIIVNRTLDFARQGESLLFMANSAGIASENFTKMALAVERLGGSRSGFAGTIGGLQASLMGLRRGEENALSTTAMYYGLSLQGRNGIASADEMLENIARAMQGRSGAEQADMARMLGLDEGTFRLVQQGVAGVRRELELADKYNPFKDEETMREIQLFQYTLREMKMAFSAVVGEVAKQLLPHFQRWAEISKSVFDTILDNKDKVLAVLTAIGAGILALMGPWYLLAGIVLLLIDDFATFKRGGESMFKPIWEGVDKAISALEKLGGWFDSKKDTWWMKYLMGVVRRIENPLQGIADAKEMLTNIDFSAVGQNAQVARAGMAGAFNQTVYANFSVSGTMEAVKNGLTNFWNNITGRGKEVEAGLETAGGDE